MTTSTAPSHGTAIVVTIAVLILAGCTPTSSAPVATPTSAAATPAPAPTVDPVAEPVPGIDPVCDELGRMLPLETTFVTEVAPRSSARTEYGARPSRPDEYIVRSAGGFVCEFSNGQPQSQYSGTNPAYVGVVVFVLPEPGEQWTRYLESVGATDNRRAGCNDRNGTASCTLEALSANRAIEARVAGAVSVAAGTELTDAVLAAAASLPAGSAPQTPPAGTLELPDECDTYISGASVQTITNFSGELEVVSIAGGQGGFNVRFAAELVDGSPMCYFQVAVLGGGIGTLSVLREGEWAWAEAQSLVDSTPITIAGLAEGDEAWLRCSTSDAGCVLDLVLGGNWIEVYLWDNVFGFDRRVAVQEIAATVVANVGA